MHFQVQDRRGEALLHGPQGHTRAATWFAMVGCVQAELNCACTWKSTQVRVYPSANVYDGELEYWVTVRERGERTETVTREERQSQKEQALRLHV